MQPPNAYQCVQPAWDTRRVFGIFVALGFSHCDGESPFPPQAANASRWTPHPTFTDSRGATSDLFQSRINKTFLKIALEEE
jgi:hypothetical protein